MIVSNTVEIKKELQNLSQKAIIELCLHLVKYKKDNKEYLNYLLFQAHSKSSYIESIKLEMDENFSDVSLQPNLYFVKKTLRKHLKTLNKYCKYINDKASAAELHIYFCKKLKTSKIPYEHSQLLVNLYEQQLKKIKTLISALHEDLQLDYLNEYQSLL